MDKTFIHIGYPKTGTTWFQNNVYPYIKDVLFYHRKTVKDDFILSNALNFNADELKIKYSNLSSTILLSHELLVGGMIHMGGVNGILTKEFCQRLYHVFPHGHIIIFIRNQADMIASAYNQYIRGGGNYGINKYLYQNSFDSLNKFFFFNFSFLEYDKIISLYKSKFDEQNVHVFLFEDFQKDPTSFVTNFAKEFELDIDLNNINFTPINTKFRKNIKLIFKLSNILYRRAVIHKRHFFKFDNMHAKMKARYNHWNQYKIFGKFETTEEVLGKKNLKYINNFYKDSNRKLIGIHKLNSIKQYNYPI